MTYKVVKRFGHEMGLSAAFRQWRAASHCRFVHGYPLAFEFEYHAHELDDRNWVVDFGDLKDIKQWLQLTFDHKLVVAADDPEIAFFEGMQERGLVELTVLPHVGCEAFAEQAWRMAAHLLNEKQKAGQYHGVRLHEVRVWEHPGNMAAYTNELAKVHF